MAINIQGLVAAAGVLGSPLLASGLGYALFAPVPAEASGLSEREERLYHYSFNWGWVGATCMHFETGRTPHSWLVAVVDRIEEDDDLTASAKKHIWDNLSEMENSPKCKRAVQAILRKRGGVSPAFNYNTEAY